MQLRAMAYTGDHTGIGAFAGSRTPTRCKEYQVMKTWLLPSSWTRITTIRCFPHCSNTPVVENSTMVQYSLLLVNCSRISFKNSVGCWHTPSSRAAFHYAMPKPFSMDLAIADKRSALKKHPHYHRVHLSLKNDNHPYCCLKPTRSHMRQETK